MGCGKVAELQLSAPPGSVYATWWQQGKDQGKGIYFQGRTI